MSKTLMTTMIALSVAGLALAAAPAASAFECGTPPGGDPTAAHYCNQVRDDAKSVYEWAQEGVGIVEEIASHYP